jgi:hypothetical protein
MTTAAARRNLPRGGGHAVLPGTYIRFYCVAHRPAENVRSPLTIHQASWAYCPGDETGEHQWSAIAPTSYADIRGKAFSEDLNEAKAR